MTPGVRRVPPGPERVSNGCQRPRPFSVAAGDTFRAAASISWVVSVPCPWRLSVKPMPPDSTHRIPPRQKPYIPYCPNTHRGRELARRAKRTALAARRIRRLLEAMD